MTRTFTLAALIIALFGMTTAVYAVNPREMLANPKLELRAREISKELRCLVCQNQSIDDSDADLARDLRVLVRERIIEGDSDQEVLEFVVRRYGDFVLLRPPVKGATLILWGGPAAIALFGLLAVILFLRRNRQRLLAGVAAADAASSSMPPDASSRADKMNRTDIAASQSGKAAPLTDAEQARLDELLKGGRT